jgi:hypothetical protein
MRPGQNKRMRGRNNRKGPNPLTRTYESNGPDVKIRGTAHHVAEKYLQLARDAHSSGDPVMAESYLQHAEHYFRLIAAAQQAQMQAQPGYVRPADVAETDDSDDDDDFGGMPDRFASPQERAPQPVFSPPQGQQPPQFGAGPQPYAERPQAPERGPRPDRPFHDRNARRRTPDNRPPRDGNSDQAQPRFDLPKPAVEEPSAGLPAFITGGAPRPNPSQDQAPPEETAFRDTPEVEGEHEGASYHLRSRRRRRRPGAAEGGEGQPMTGELPVAE